MERIKQAGQPAERERSIGVKELQIYGNGRLYALVGKNGNYSVNTKTEVIHGFTNFCPQDASWLPVDPASVPSWLAEQIKDFDLFDADEA